MELSDGRCDELRAPAPTDARLRTRQGTASLARVSVPLQPKRRWYNVRHFVRRTHCECYKRHGQRDCDWVSLRSTSSIESAGLLLFLTQHTGSSHAKANKNVTCSELQATSPNVDL